ncbi:multiple cyclophane-containing RiPP AmcA [Nonomuraea longicatena]|uniref:Uncharacterized protein n=1 Tax=Nonomuraea longicatena TaxID=83682 RepID=A0ABN1NSQ1_9ACTN
MPVLEFLTTTDSKTVQDLIRLHHPGLAPSAHAKFDNKPTWDNWSKKSPSPFDNRPTWDNWSKK